MCKGIMLMIALGWVVQIMGVGTVLTMCMSNHRMAMLQNMSMVAFIPMGMCDCLMCVIIWIWSLKWMGMRTIGSMFVDHRFMLVRGSSSLGNSSQKDIAGLLLENIAQLGAEDVRVESQLRGWSSYSQANGG